MFLFGDLRFAVRTVLRMPALAAVVVGSLAAGIGANTVVFSWIESVVFKPVAGVPESGRLYLVEPRSGTAMYPGASWLEYRDLREQLRAFDSLIAFKMVPLYVGERGRVERSSGLLVSDNYFSSLRLTPALGRFFRPEEVQAPGGAPVAVISYDYWQTRYSGQPAALGQRIRVNGADLTIVGVAPREFKGTMMRLMFDVWLPATLAPVLLNGARDLEDRNAREYSVTGFLAPGVTQARAQTEVDVLMRQLAAAYPGSNKTMQAEVLPFWESPRGPQRLMATSLVILQSITLLLLLAVCGNTGNLLLARASARQREMSIRIALGAGRARVLSLVLTENLILGLCGAVVGAALGVWGTAALSAVPPLRVRGIPISFETAVDGASLLFAVGLGVACGLIFGFAPALQLARIDPQLTLHRGFTTAPRSRTRRALIGLEVAFATVVLVAAGLFLRNFMATRQDDPGFARDGVLLAGYDLTGRAADESRLRTFAASLLERLRSEPDVQAVAIATSVPLDLHGMPMRAFILEGRPPSDDGQDQALANVVTPGYFALMGIPLLRGRDFADVRDASAPPQVIVNEAFVSRYLDGAEPLGRWVETRGRRAIITAVVRNSVYNAFGEPPTPILYYSLRDRPSAAAEIHLRPRRGADAAVVSGLRRIVGELDPELPLYDVRTLGDYIESNLIFRRIPARMFAVLGPLLLLLAATGIYAAVAYAVSLRSREIGVRMALGATPRLLVARFVADNMAVVSVGALGGWLVAFMFVLDVLDAPVDAGVFAGVPAVLLCVAGVASWWPARRITELDPVVALRSE